MTLHRRVDVALGRAHHADDLEVRPQLAALAALEDQPQRLALALGDRREADVHDVDADVGQHPRELVLVLRRDGDAGHLLAVAQRVVVDADLVRRRELQVVVEARGVAGELRRAAPAARPALSIHAAVAACRRSSRRLRTQGTRPPMCRSSFMNCGKASQRYSSPLREVAHDPLLEVDLELVALVHALGRLRRLEDRVAHVDRVAEEDARVGVGDHQRDARAADRHRRDLARRAAAEVRAGDQDVARRRPATPRSRGPARLPSRACRAPSRRASRSRTWPG